MSSALLFGYIMKMHSYIVTNLLLHIGAKKKYEEIVGSTKKHPEHVGSPTDPDCIYPANVNLKDFFRFIYCVPILVYETKFLWIKKFRVFYVIKELFNLILCSLGIILIFSQFILPVALDNTRSTLMKTMSDICYLCIPSLFVWILTFYTYIHCWLNLMSEIVGFSNREFYSDWWNASSIGVFWRKWNIPLHEWSLRHLYIDTMYYFNISKNTASIILFLATALINEFHLSVAFKINYPFFIFAMICQLPLVLLNKAVRNSKHDGNYLMWISLMIGQPLLEILYFRSWVSINCKSGISFWCN